MKFRKNYLKGMALVLVISITFPQVNFYKVNAENSGIKTESNLFSDGGLEHPYTLEETLALTHSDKLYWTEGRPKDFYIANPSLGTKVIYDTSEKSEGMQSLRINMAQTSGYINSARTIKPNTEYILSYDYKIMSGTTLGSANVEFRSQQYDNTTPTPKTIGSAYTIANPIVDKWSSYEETITTESNASTLRIVIQLAKNNTNPSTGTIWVDNFKLIEKVDATKAITIKNPITTMDENTSVTLVAEITPESASNEAVIWTSSNESIAKVDGHGNVTTLKSGEVTIIATLKDTPTVFNECTISVIKNIFNDGGFEGIPGATNINWPQGIPKDFYIANPVDGIKGYYDANTKTEGHQSLRIDMSNVTGYLNSARPVKPNTEYILSYDYKVATGTPLGANNIEFRSQQYTSTSQVTGSTYKVTTGTVNEWNSYKESITTLNNAASLRIVIQLGRSALTSGTIWVDNFRLIEVSKSVTEVNITEKPAEMFLGDSVSLIGKVKPADAWNPDIDWESSNTSIAVINQTGQVTAIGEGVVIITAKSKETPDIIDTCTIIVKKIPSTEGITVENMPKEMNTDSGVMVTATRIPVGAKDEIKWSSSNENIAIVNDGLIIAKQAGTVTITAFVTDAIKTSYNIAVKEAVLDDYDKLRVEWRNRILPYEIDTTNETTMEIINGTVDNAKFYWENMNFEPNTKLWTLPELNNETSFSTNYYNYLKTMTIAFLSDGSELQYNPDLYRDIIRGLDWCQQYVFTSAKLRYSPTSTATKDTGLPDSPYTIVNWWHKDLGIPLSFNQTSILLYDYIPQEKSMEYANRVKVFTPTPRLVVSPGTSFSAQVANRVDKCTAITANGILLKDISRIEQAATGLFDSTSITMGDYTQKGNGFYYDGSLLEHDTYPYAGAYGTVSIEGISTLMHFIGNKTIDGKEIILDQNAIARMYKYLDDSYIPYMYQGLVMDAVSGRGISRPKSNDLNRGATIVKTIYLLSDFAPTEEKKMAYKEYAKYWAEQNPEMMKSSYLFVNQLFQDLIDNDDIISRPDKSGIHQMNKSARTVYKRDDFNFTIAMSSTNISSYEAINTENKLGYHTGDGMTYLYNDNNQFNGNYWATVDYKRLPGTTVDTLSMDSLKTTADGNMKIGQSPNKLQTWVGGTKLDDYGTTGYSMNMKGRQFGGSLTSLKDDSKGMDLVGNKSWFMLGDKVIALGSGITSSTGRTVETTVDNRKLDIDASNLFTVNGNVIHTGDSSIINAKWAYVEGSEAGKSTGYYFPQGETITASKVLRTSTWFETNGGGSKEDVSDYYAQLIVDHGKDPNNKTYSYVLLPNKSEEEIAAYAENPDFEILAQTPTLHAVKDFGLGITSINNFAKTPQSVDGITVSREASVMIREYDSNILKIAVTDPTTTILNEVVTISIDKKYAGLVSKDDNVTIKSSEGENLIIEVKTNITNMSQNTWYAEIKIAE